MKIKKFLRRFIPAGRTYIDKKFQDEQKLIKKQIADLQEQMLKEFSRRDEWEKRPAEIKREAGDRPVWVIKCPAPERGMLNRWGDYAFALSLKKYLERHDLYVLVDTREDWNCESDADVVIVLRGVAFYRPDRRNEKCFYIMWNISHPDMVTEEEYNLYDVVCVGSRHYAAQLQKRVKVPVLPLLQCTDTELFYPQNEASGTSGQDYVFVGSSRGVVRNCVVWAVEDQLPLRIWGGGWNKILQEKAEDLVEDVSVPNSAIPDIYRSAKATINDHWADMLDRQFINNRIFDAMACGLPVISDTCEELKEIFPDAVLHYSSKEEFRECVRQIEENYEDVKKRVLAQQELIKENYSFAARARELTEIAAKYKRS